VDYIIFISYKKSRLFGGFFISSMSRGEKIRCFRLIDHVNPYSGEQG
jgi:hypothetical protein